METSTTLPNYIDLKSLQLYLDGGDGSLWLSRDCWEIILSNPDDEMATRRFIRVSDLLDLLLKSGITLTDSKVT